ncbi:MAG TPA: hypothetical protein DIW47_15660 [Bacteroidetes bacterium]|nr:hypothetical protein [Bacteroidota bacterium]
MDRALIFLIVFSFSFSSLLGQTPTKEQLLKRKASQIVKYDSGTAQANQYFLRMDFSGSKILNPREHEAHLGKKIERIELYYTNFQISDSFQQSGLNGKRLDELEKLIPGVYKQTGISWHFIGQKGAKTPEEAATYFHGFVITYRDVPFMERSTEILMMDSVSKALEVIKDTVEGIECRNITKTRKKWTGSYLPKSGKKLEKGIRYKRRGLWNRKREYMTLAKTTTICDTSWGVSGSLSGFTYVSDTTVMQVLERKMKDWKKAVIVTDVTGSMYPYIVQLQVWMRLNFHLTDCRHFVFFNDGDKKYDGSKRVGKVGGIYSGKASSYSAMEVLCKRAMAGGYGGDGQENDIEAMLEAQKKFRECNEIVLIADNYAPVRDMALLKDLKIPVHVILCGTASGYVNVEYLEIAYKTGGSVHTIEEDIENMTKLSEGSVIEIMGQLYKINKGKFVAVKGT